MKNRRIGLVIVALFVCMIMAFTLVSCMDAENYHTKDDISSLIGELEATMTEKATANADAIAALRAEYTTKTSGLETAISENKTLIANLTLAHSTKVAELEQANKKISDELSALKATYATDLAALEKADGDNKAAIDALTSEYNKKVAALEQADDTNAKAIADLTKDYNTQVEKLESAIKQANDTIVSYKIALEESIADLETKQDAQIAEIKTLIATVQSANTSQEQKIALLANQIIELQKSMQIERVEFDANGNLVLHFVGGTSQTVNAPEKHVHAFGEWILFQKSAQSCEYLIYYHVCESCGALEWNQQSTERIEHSFGAGEVTREPTCSKKGEMTYTCEHCGYEMTEDIAVVPHTYDRNAFASDGTTHWHACVECGAKDEDSQSDHTWNAGEVTTEPTCTDDGEKTFKCKVCDAAMPEKTEAVPALGHDVDEEAFESNGTTHWNVCEREGCGAKVNEEACDMDFMGLDDVYCAKVCFICSYIDESTMVEHDLDAGKVTRKATCTKKGEMTYTCENCGYEIVEDIAVVPHTYNDGEVIREATCSKKGEMTYTCENCGLEIVEDIAVVPHTYDEAKWGGDDTQHWIPCTVCGQAKDGTQGNHNFGSEITVYPVAGFCKPGEIYQECADCGRKVISTYIPSDAPHTFVFDAAKSELQEGGVQAGTLVYSCSACDFSYSIDAIGLKNFDDKTRAGNVWGVPTSDKASLTYENGNITVVGPIDSKASLGNTPNFDINNNPQNEGIVFANGKSVVLGFDFGAPTGGFPEANFHTSTKLSNNWGMSGLIVNGDGTMTYNGQPIGTADHTKMTSFVVKFVLDPSTLMVNFTVWIDGVKVLTDATPYPGNASASASFQDATTYMNITITPNAANVALDRGLIIDNIFYANEVPEYLSAQ